MKKIAFILSIISIFLLSSCGGYYEINEKDKVHTEKLREGTTEYIVNKASGTYHLENCYIVNNIKEENKIITTDIEFLVERQYTPCKKCMPKK